MNNDRKASWILVPLVLGVALVVLVFSPAGYRPDRPVAHIVAGSSQGPAFVVQIIRPRMGLPLGGVLPPQLFGLDAHLGFDSKSAGASIGAVEPGRIELGADGWDLVLVGDGDGGVSPETRVTFELVFEERLRRVCCRPGVPAVGSLAARALEDSARLSGSFDIELDRCEDASTGEPIRWPPDPLLLRGSFDILPLDGGTKDADSIQRSTADQAE